MSFKLLSKWIILKAGCSKMVWFRMFLSKSCKSICFCKGNLFFGQSSGKHLNQQHILLTIRKEKNKKNKFVLETYLTEERNILEIYTARNKSSLHKCTLRCCFFMQLCVPCMFPHFFLSCTLVIYLFSNSFFSVLYYCFSNSKTA